MNDDQPTPAHLAPTEAIDSEHPAVQAFAREHARGADERERAVALTHAVRDAFRYDPYRIDLSPYGMRASTVIELGYGPAPELAARLKQFVATVEEVAARHQRTVDSVEAADLRHVGGYALRLRGVGLAIDRDMVGGRHFQAHRRDLAVHAHPATLDPLVGLAARAQAHVGQTLVQAHRAGAALRCAAAARGGGCAPPAGGGGRGVGHE